MTEVSIVVVTYHTGPALWVCVESVLRQPECVQLIIVDNGNPADVVSRLEALSQSDSRVCYLKQQKNLGFAKACNTGVNKATAEYVLLLNPDCVLPKQALSRSVEELNRRPDVALVGCRLIDPDGTEQRGSRRNIMTLRNSVMDAIGLSRLLPVHERLNIHTEPMPDQPHEVAAISGAYLFSRTRDYLALGGLDEGYFLHMEDMDFCKRIRDVAKKIVCIPDVNVIHFRSSSDASDAFVEWQKTKGFIRYFSKHFRTHYLPGLLPLFYLGIVLRYALMQLFGLVRPLANPDAYHDRQMRRSIALQHYLFKEPLHESLKDKHFLITGASSQIGLCLIGLLLASGSKVMAFSRETPSPLLHPHLTWRQFDLGLKSFAEEEAVSMTLIHTAPIWLLPAQIERLAQLGIRRVVAFSSTSIIGKQESNDPHEQETVAALKVAEESLAMQCVAHQISYTILRPTMVYGVGLDANVTRIARTIARYGMFPIYGAAQGKRQPVHAEDLAKAALQCASHPKTVNKTYTCSGGSIVTYRQMIEQIATALGKPVRLVRIPLMRPLLNLLGKLYGASHINGEMATRMNRDLMFDFQDAFIDFGYEPRLFQVTTDML